ncbi:MAG: hypothetical protein QW292_05810 [Candidatus Parvarchaeota archaeon]
MEFRTKGRGKDRTVYPLRKPYGESRAEAEKTVQEMREQGYRMRLIETNRKRKLYAPYESILQGGEILETEEVHAPKEVKIEKQVEKNDQEQTSHREEEKEERERYIPYSEVQKLEDQYYTAQKEGNELLSRKIKEELDRKRKEYQEQLQRDAPTPEEAWKMEEEYYNALQELKKRGRPKPKRTSYERLRIRERSNYERLTKEIGKIREEAQSDKGRIPLNAKIKAYPNGEEVTFFTDHGRNYAMSLGYAYRPATRRDSVGEYYYTADINPAYYKGDKSTATIGTDNKWGNHVEVVQKVSKSWKDVVQWVNDHMDWNKL